MSIQIKILLYTFPFFGLFKCDIGLQNLQSLANISLGTDFIQYFFVENFMLIIITSIIFALKSVTNEILAKDCTIFRPISHLKNPKNGNVYIRISICNDVLYHLCEYPS